MKRPGRPVLVVEDHEDSREMVATFLRLDGYRVTTAGNGVEALGAVARDLPCLILLDVTMPVMDGPTFARRLRQSPDRAVAETPIVLLTALPEAARVQREVGAVALIRKPVCFDALTSTLERHCTTGDA